MTKEIIRTKLAHLGLDPSLCGFNHLVELMTILPEEPGNIVTLYADAAKLRNTTGPRLERGIRHMVDRFYDEHIDVHPLLCPNAASGRLTISQFAYKLRLLLKEDSGYTKDGRAWVILETGNNRYEVRVFVAGGNYWVYRGSHNDCVNYILGGGMVNAV